VQLAIIVPVLNEGLILPLTLERLLPFRARGAEVILVDGGSEDGSIEIARRTGVTVLNSARGRALQMNAGAQAASSKILVFLHADTELPPDADRLIDGALRDSRHIWGRFNVCIQGRFRILAVVSMLMNWRSRLTGIATGDQAIFVARSAFEKIGRFPEQPLMEDIELSKRLRALARPVSLRACVIVSGRRWETHGVWRTIFLMWRLRWAYWRGVPAIELANAYR
jgi:rSAM/selenodomain-associated transferase 2